MIEGGCFNLNRINQKTFGVNFDFFDEFGSVIVLKFDTELGKDVDLTKAINFKTKTIQPNNSSTLRLLQDNQNSAESNTTNSTNSTNSTNTTTAVVSTPTVESVYSGLIDITEIKLDNSRKKTFIYLETKDTIDQMNLEFELNANKIHSKDSFLEILNSEKIEIKNFQVQKIPILDGIFRWLAFAIWILGTITITFGFFTSLYKIKNFVKFLQITRLLLLASTTNPHNLESLTYSLRSRSVLEIFPSSWIRIKSSSFTCSPSPIFFKSGLTCYAFNNFSPIFLLIFFLLLIPVVSYSTIILCLKPTVNPEERKEIQKIMKENKNLKEDDLNILVVNKFPRLGDSKTVTKLKQLIRVFNLKFWVYVLDLIFIELNFFLVSNIMFITVSKLETGIQQFFYFSVFLLEVTLLYLVVKFLSFSQILRKTEQEEIEEDTVSTIGGFSGSSFSSFNTQEIKMALDELKFNKRWGFLINDCMILGRFRGALFLKDHLLSSFLAIFWRFYYIQYPLLFLGLLGWFITFDILQKKKTKEMKESEKLEEKIEVVKLEEKEEEKLKKKKEIRKEYIFNTKLNLSALGSLCLILLLKQIFLDIGMGLVACYFIFGVSISLLILTLVIYNLISFWKIQILPKLKKNKAQVKPKNLDKEFELVDQSMNEDARDKSMILQEGPSAPAREKERQKKIVRKNLHRMVIKEEEDEDDTPEKQVQFDSEELDQSGGVIENHVRDIPDKSFFNKDKDKDREFETEEYVEFQGKRFRKRSHKLEPIDEEKRSSIIQSMLILDVTDEIEEKPVANNQD